MLSCIPSNFLYSRVPSKPLCSFQLGGLFLYSSSLSQSFHGNRAEVISATGFDPVAYHLLVSILHFFFLISSFPSSAVFTGLLIH